MPNAKQKAPTAEADEKIAYRIQDAIRVSGLSRTTLYQLIKTGELKSVVVAGRRLIIADALRSLIQGGSAQRPAA